MRQHISGQRDLNWMSYLLWNGIVSLRRSSYPIFIFQIWRLMWRLTALWHWCGREQSQIKFLIAQLYNLEVTVKIASSFHQNSLLKQKSWLKASAESNNEHIPLLFADVAAVTRVSSTASINLPPFDLQLWKKVGV